MNSARFLVRRATVDDLGGLKELWTRAGLQVLDLERRLTEFQLVSSLGGDLAGAIALRVEGDQGCLHSEAFTQTDEQDDFRQLLWERVKTVARNHGLARVWTLELAPFWHQAAEFREVRPEEFSKLPAAFGQAHQRWQTLVLRNEEHRGISLEREFELFQQASQASVNRVVNQTEKLRLLAYVVAGVLFIGLFGFALYATLSRRRESDARSGRRR